MINAASTDVVLVGVVAPFEDAEEGSDSVAEECFADLCPWQRRQESAKLVLRTVLDTSTLGSRWVRHDEGAMQDSGKQRRRRKVERRCCDIRNGD